MKLVKVEKFLASGCGASSIPLKNSEEAGGIGKQPGTGVGREGPKGGGKKWVERSKMFVARGWGGSVGLAEGARWTSWNNRDIQAGGSEEKITVLEGVRPP